MPAPRFVRKTNHPSAKLLDESLLRCHEQVKTQEARLRIVIREAAPCGLLRGLVGVWSPHELRLNCERPKRLRVETEDNT